LEQVLELLREREPRASLKVRFLVVVVMAVVPLQLPLWNPKILMVMKLRIVSSKRPKSPSA
jgi:hypothetical protein